MQTNRPSGFKARTAADRNALNIIKLFINIRYAVPETLELQDEFCDFLVGTIRSISSAKLIGGS